MRSLGHCPSENVLSAIWVPSLAHSFHQWSLSCRSTFTALGFLFLSILNQTEVPLVAFHASVHCYYSSWFPFGRMSGAAFPSPAAEMAEINRLQYEMEYTEGISQRMRVPEKLKVAPQNADLEKSIPEGFPNASVTMQVPERIVVAGMSASQYGKNRPKFKSLKFLKGQTYI